MRVLISSKTLEFPVLSFKLSSNIVLLESTCSSIKYNFKCNFHVNLIIMEYQIRECQLILKAIYDLMFDYCVLIGCSKCVVARNHANYDE